MIVSDFQLSLAIGKGARTHACGAPDGGRIDIKSETQLAEEEAGGYGDQDWAEGEWVEDESGELVWKPAEGGEAMSAEGMDAPGGGRDTTRPLPKRSRPTGSPRREPRRRAAPVVQDTSAEVPLDAAPAEAAVSEEAEA